MATDFGNNSPKITCNVVMKAKTMITLMVLAATTAKVSDVSIPTAFRVGARVFSKLAMGSLSRVAMAF